ncbi:MAG TPA: SRPBCC domain-containing protein [Rhodocyclaceae bacterium]|nr:SRPBCC domain-containing protein [Rhodocyclaceae bacterium]
MNAMASVPTIGTELVFTRILDAPRALAFKVWTDPAHLAKWWGPKDFTNPVCEADVRPGGALKIVMRGPDGTDYPMTGAFIEIAPPERLVLNTTAFEDDAGNPRLEVLCTVIFTEYNGKTKLTLTTRVIKAGPEVAQALAGMQEGWSQSLDRLAQLLSKF